MSTIEKFEARKLARLVCRMLSGLMRYLETSDIRGRKFR